MVGRQRDSFSNRVLHYASSLHGTRQYWYKQRSRLIALVDSLGMPTISFTHSSADHQWPELARLMSTECHTVTDQRKAVIDNPAIQ